MAGKRRAAGKPLKRVAGTERRRERMLAELAAAKTDADRVMAVADWVRSGLVSRPEPDEAARIVKQLTAAGNRIYGWKEDPDGDAE